MKNINKKQIMDELGANIKIKFADQTLTFSLDKEIQEIFKVLRDDPNGEIWASSESHISDVTSSKKDLNRVQDKLGIEITSHDTFVDAALKLRSVRRIKICSE